MTAGVTGPRHTGPGALDKSGTPARIVALYGYFAYGNFGDDLMAVIFGTQARQLGYRVKAYKLCSRAAEWAGFEVVDSLDELIEGANLLILAGGSLLVSGLTAQTFGIGKRLFKNLAQGDQEFIQLLELSRQHDVPLSALSIGGDDESFGALPVTKLQLLLNPQAWHRQAHM